MGAEILCELLKVQHPVLVGVPGLDELKTQTDKNKRQADIWPGTERSYSETEARL